MCKFDLLAELTEKDNTKVTEEWDWFMAKYGVNYADLNSEGREMADRLAERQSLRSLGIMKKCGCEYK